MDMRHGNRERKESQNSEPDPTFDYSVADTKVRLAVKNVWKGGAAAVGKAFVVTLHTVR